MSVLPQELLRKASDNAQEISEPSNEVDVQDERFRDLLKVSAVDEKPREKNFFSLFEEEDKDVAPSTAPYVSTLFQCQEFTSLSPTIMPIILSPDVAALFERMASCMIVMSSSQEVETTLFLDNPSSIFFGMRITIREFSTAPKTFNIEIASTAQTIATLNASKSDLLAAFQQGKFNFSVHRFETEIQRDQERPVLCRKESGDKQEQKEGRDQ